MHNAESKEEEKSGEAHYTRNAFCLVLAEGVCTIQHILTAKRRRTWPAGVYESPNGRQRLLSRSSHCLTSENVVLVWRLRCTEILVANVRCVKEIHTRCTKMSFITSSLLSTHDGIPRWATGVPLKTTAFLLAWNWKWLISYSTEVADMHEKPSYDKTTTCATYISACRDSSVCRYQHLQAADEDHSQ